MEEMNKDAERVYLRKMSIVVHISSKGAQKTIIYRL